MAKPDRDAMEAEPQPRIRVVMNAALGELPPASAQIRHFLSGHGVDKAGVFAIEMAIEELATNAIKYAFGASGKGKITIEASVTAERAGLLIEDDGDAFNPTEAPTPEVHRSLEDMPIGGLGIHLARELTDGFEYHRVDDRNQVRVWVKRKS